MLKRNIFQDVIEWLDRDKVILIKGARQVGKTTLLFEIRNYLQSQQKQVIYLAADEYFDSDFFTDARLFLKYLNFEYAVTKNAYVLIDEFQYLKNAGLFVKVLQDIIKREEKKIQLIISGSSSLEISKTTEFLTGRKIEFLLFPFSFQEYLTTNNKFEVSFNLNDDFSNLNDFYRIYKNELEFHFSSYILWGGYPEVALEKSIDSRRVILKEIISTYIEKDVAGFLKIENISAFNKLVQLLSSQIGSLVNRNELTNTLGMHYRTLSKYLDVLSGTFIYSFINPFYTNVRKELTKMPKIFLNDTGIFYYYHPQQSLTFNSIPGNIAENFVYTTLKRRKSINSIQFYRTVSKSEIDFIIKKWEKVIPIEVKFRKVAKVPAALSQFQNRFDTKKPIIITKNLLQDSNAAYFIPITLLDLIEL